MVTNIISNSNVTVFTFSIADKVGIFQLNSRVKHYLMSGPTHDGGEHSPRSIISCETGLAHTGAVINDQGGDFIFHFCTGKKKTEMRLTSLPGCAACLSLLSQCTIGE